MAFPPFKKRLSSIMRDGNLTATDVAQWLDATRSTVNAWLRGVSPLNNKLLFLLARVNQLETLIEQGKKLPVPLYIKRQDRKSYINELKKDAHHAISPKNPTTKRRQTVVGKAR